MTSFTAIYGGDKIEFHFVRDDQGAPIKLGDGTFGCVFRVHDNAKNDYALKIFYEPRDDLEATNQNIEMRLNEILRSAFKNEIQRANEIYRYIVVARAYVDNFKSSEAYNALKDHFEKWSFEVSNKAIVMDIYPMSLKDVLERGWEADVASAKPGYSMLRGVSQRERENCILPLARQLADALSILYEAESNHQDIKPANVLVRQVGPNIEVALSDLGFVNAGQAQKPGNVHQMQPLGTRHYRSPEQTDFFDTCEVDLSPLEDGDYELTTHDPKFFDTFAEPGDLVVFSKLPEPVQWKIKNIEFGSRSSGSSVVTMRIKGLPSIKLQSDVGTQITVYKRQTARTDMFGLGAIMFDMLTCGRSPERFYDLLRLHDQPGKDIRNGLARMYVNYRYGGGTVPEIDAIFQDMRVDNNSDFPHPDLVRIILMCMMSNPSDSYWNRGKWTAVKQDLDALITELDCFRYSQIRFNHLTNRRDLPASSRPLSSGPKKTLLGIQNLSYGKENQCAERLVLGIRYLEKVADMLKTEMQFGQGIHYLVNVSPNSLTEQRSAFVSRHVFFESETDYNAAVESGHPRALVQLFPAGGLRPPFIDALVQEGEIWVPTGSRRKKRKGRPDDEICLGYELWDGGKSWKGIDDCSLLFDLTTTERINRKIAGVDDGLLYLSGAGNLAEKLSAKAGRYRVYFVRELDRSLYYLPKHPGSIVSTAVT